MHYVIPARKGSKGVPYKNRALFKRTADMVVGGNVIVTTDDEYISKMADEYGFIVIERPPDLANDTAHTRGVMEHVVEYCGFDGNETLIMLYLTYPYRKREDISRAIEVFNFQDAKSLLCKMPIASNHPYLYVYEDGRKLVDHDLYRRQDYPPIFEMSHYICMFKASELVALSKNMWNSRTLFMDIDRQLDIDTATDMNKFSTGDTK